MDDEAGRLERSRGGEYIVVFVLTSFMCSLLLLLLLFLLLLLLLRLLLRLRPLLPTCTHASTT